MQYASGILQPPVQKLVATIRGCSAASVIESYIVHPNTASLPAGLCFFYHRTRPHRNTPCQWHMAASAIESYIVRPSSTIHEKSEPIPRRGEVRIFAFYYRFNLMDVCTGSLTSKVRLPVLYNIINTYAFVVPPQAYCTGRETLAGALSPCRSRWTAVSAMSATGCTMVEQTYRPVAKSRMPS